MAISANHEMVTGTNKIITVRNLRDVLPAHYCKNTAQNLQKDLTDLQRRYKAQSHKLCQIIALTAELDRRKHAVSIKKEELVAVRQDIDRLPDVSSELAVSRHDLRISKARIHESHRQNTDTLSDLTSAVAGDQLESPTIQQGVADVDVYTEKAIARNLDKLNTDIQRTSKRICTHFIRHAQSLVPEEQLSAAQRASSSISQTFVDHLRTTSRYNLPLFMPIALRAYLTFHLPSIISSWTLEKGTDEIVGKMYEHWYPKESQSFVAGWRSLATTYIPTPTDNSDTLVSQIIQGLSDILVTAGCAASTSDACAKMSPKFWNDISSMITTTEKLKALIGEAHAADFRVVVVRPGQKFDGNTMVADRDRGPPMEMRGRVLCTSRLGLIKEVVKESQQPGQKHTLAVATVMKATVVLPV